MTLVILADSKIHIYESLGMIGIYVLYVIVVIVGRKIYQSRKKRKQDRIAAKQENARAEELTVRTKGTPNLNLVVDDDDQDTETLAAMFDDRDDAGYGQLQMAPRQPDANALSVAKRL